MTLIIATGKKLKETIGSNVTDYNGNTIYKNGVLYQISNDEWRIINGEYEYNIKDHLGNLRVAFRDSLGVAKITQHNAYGIFGEDLPSISYFKALWKKDEFRFTGQENLPETGYTDFGARLYDNIVPRFLTIDPLSELNRRFSPTVYGNNNPQRFIDPDGMMARGLVDDLWDKSGENTTWTNNGDGSFSIANTQTGGGDDKGKEHPAQKVQRELRERNANDPQNNAFGNGMGNVTFGSVGTVGAILAVPETMGVSALALLFTIPEVGIGTAQMIDAKTNSNFSADSYLHKGNSILGLPAYAYGSEYAPYYDALGQFAPGLFGGGNIGGIRDGFSLIVNAGKKGNFINATYELASLTDAVLDTKGVWDATRKLTNNSQASSPLFDKQKVEQIKNFIHKLPKK
ncbi:MAG: RHS repeat-associated core domain-containing protein [Arcicella sp.]|nr:RHS repeat-associated core domain-containing protein [Arcicella sp.]